MEGTKEIDELMRPVITALNRRGIKGDARTDIYNRAYEAIMISMNVNALRAENERLKGVIADYRQDIARVLDEQCPTDERHCGCVPILRAEIERLRGALEGYAKEDNWLNFEGHDVWQRDEPGSELATKALKGGGDECTPMTKF